MDRTLIGITFAVYLVALLVIGIVAYRRTTNLSDYILGGRRMGSWVTALSAGASDMSGWLLLGLPGFAYASGFEAGWMAVGLFAGTYLNWRLVAGRLRRLTGAFDSLTIPDYFERRFADTSGLLRFISATVILVFFTFYTSSGLVAGGKLFESVFGLPYLWAVAVGAGSIILYTFLGGYFAVCWTDFFQALLMALCLVAVPLIVIEETGGFGVMLDRVREVNPHLLDLFHDNQGRALGFVGIASLLAWGLGYVGQPHILARFKGISSETRLPAARRIGVTWVIVMLTAAILVGYSGIGLVDLKGADTEKIFIRLAQMLFHPAVAGVCLAAILAAIMSTADSQLLVASAAVTEDFYKVYVRRNAGQGEQVWVGRFAVLIIAVAAFLFAMDPDSRVLELVAYAWAGFGAAFGPAVVLSLYWRRMSRWGALAGIVTGGATVIIWKQLDGGLFDLYEILPGVVLAALAIIGVSLLTPASRAVEDGFRQAMRPPASPAG